MKLVYGIFLGWGCCLLSTLYCDNFSVIFSQVDYFHQKGVRMEFRIKYAWNRKILGKHFISLFFVQTGEIGWIEVVGFSVFHILRPQTNFLKLILTYANFTRRRVPPSPDSDFNYKDIRKYRGKSSVSFLLLATHFHCCSPAPWSSRHRDWEALNKMTVTTHRIKQKPIENTIKTLFLCQRKWSSMKSVK